MQLKNKDLLRFQGLIDGRWQDARSAATVEVLDPASQSAIGTVPDMGKEETRAAIEAAGRAFAPWKRKTHAERAALIEAWHGLMIEHEEDLARILTAEQGKPLAEARGEIRYGASFVKWFAEEARRIDGDDDPVADARPPHPRA